MAFLPRIGLLRAQSPRPALSFLFFPGILWKAIKIPLVSYEGLLLLCDLRRTYTHARRTYRMMLPSEEEGESILVPPSFCDNALAVRPFLSRSRTHGRSTYRVKNSPPSLVVPTGSPAVESIAVTYAIEMISHRLDTYMKYNNLFSQILEILEICSS